MAVVVRQVCMQPELSEFVDEEKISLSAFVQAGLKDLKRRKEKAVKRKSN